jgi:hypothetical protein
MLHPLVEVAPGLTNPFSDFNRYLTLSLTWSQLVGEMMCAKR